MTTALRYQIAEACHPVKIVGRGTVSRSKLEMADAVLALPAIADLVAIREALIDAPHISYALKLAELCAPLTVEQVARALRFSSRGLSIRQDIITDDEKAIVAWEDKR